MISYYKVHKLSLCGNRGFGRSGCGGVGSQELVGGGLISARRTAPNGQAGTQDRHPRHRLASMAGKSPRSNWTSAWGLQAVRAWQVVHVWQSAGQYGE